MLFWMRRQGRAIKGDLEQGVDLALADGSTMALAGLAFVAVLREGLETVLFLFAIGSAAGPAIPTLLAAVAGLVVAVAIGWAIFALGVRIDLRRFFTITGVVLIFVSAGLIAFAIAEFTEAGLLPVTPTAFDLSTVLPDTSPLGSVLSGLFGYRAAPTVLELAGYLLYLVPVLYLFLWGGRRQSTVVAASTALFVALVAAGCGSGSTASDGPAGSADVTVQVAASEYEFTPSTLTAPAGAIAFHVTNTGSEEHEFEIFKGDQVVDEIEGLVPGLDRTLTVTLEAGDYTYVCKLAGHDAAGMTGTLTVTPS
jgi:high-affinity iron transporter